MTKRQFLAGKLLIAMPGIQSDDFAKSVVFVCVHSGEGAMGFVINKPAPRMVFSDIAEKLKLDHMTENMWQLPVMFGGPVKSFQGFVLHSSDYRSDETLHIGPDFAVTATVDILKAIAEGKGPRARILHMGYSGWNPGQLEGEIMRNSWLHCDADAELVFSHSRANLHEAALSKLGVNPAMLSRDTGRA